jgi:hypothetical protein
MQDKLEKCTEMLRLKVKLLLKINKLKIMRDIDFIILFIYLFFFYLEKKYLINFFFLFLYCSQLKYIYINI